jgi:hypothetical protein
MLSRVLGHVVGMVTDILKEIIDAVPPVEELPDEDTGGAQTETATGIGVEENGPVVKLLPEHDQRVGYGFLIAFQGMPLRSPITIALNGTTLFRRCTRVGAICVPGKHAIQDFHAMARNGGEAMGQRAMSIKTRSRSGDNK